MEYYSYLANGFQYGVLSNPESVVKLPVQGQSTVPSRDYEVKLNISPTSIVPFENVDGLTLGELKDYPNLLYRGRYVVFVMYDSIGTKTTPKGQEKAIARVIYPIDSVSMASYAIDDVLEDHYIKNITRLSEPNRKRALRLLEEQIFRNKANVDSQISGYIKKKLDYGHYDPTNKYTQISQRLIDR